jgi:hypothetical protein
MFMIRCTKVIDGEGERAGARTTKIITWYRVHTQFFLKQSWEQKKLPLIPNFRQVGHCNEPASFSQSAPRHFLFAGGSVSVMVAGGCRWIAASSFGWAGEQAGRQGPQDGSVEQGVGMR